jgi:acyl-coenzyme A thioesterase PaaI-like protein
MELMMEFKAPEGFTLIPNLPPAYDYGKFYVKAKPDGGYELGFFVRPEHSRSHAGHVGGGLLLTAADYVMGFVVFKTIYKGGTGDLHATTVSMSSDFLGTAKVGDWVTAKIDLIKLGKTLCTTQCILYNGEKPIFRSSASYMMLPKG